MAIYIIFGFGIIVSLFFIGFSALIVIKNGFVKEVIDMLYPAIGAMVVALFFMVRTLYLDAPAGIHESVHLAILQNWKTGQLHSMIPITIDNASDMFKGTRAIDAFGSSLNSEFVCKSADEAFHSDKVLYMIDYLMFDWLSQTDNSYYCLRSSFVKGINGGGGGATLSADMMLEANKKIAPEGNPLLKIDNPLFKRSPGTMILPKYFNFKRTVRINQDEVGPHYALVISSGKTEFKISIPSRSGELVNDLTDISKKILQANKIDYDANKDNLLFRSYDIELEVEQRPESRFSDKAKQEKEWLIRIINNFKNDFSWENVRKQYEAD